MPSAPEWRVSADVQLPLARPAIMTGVNQTLLLAISMLGIAAIMGAGGLGQLLFRALSNQDVSFATSGGLAFFLVAVVLARITQGEESDSGNLFHRLRQAWTHRQDAGVLVPDEAEAKTGEKGASWRFATVGPTERKWMTFTGIGSVIAIISVFLTWADDGSKISGFGRRSDEIFEGDTSFSGLSASGGSWFGFITLALGLFALASVLVALRTPGKGPRWMTTDGTVIAGIALFSSNLAYLLAWAPDLGSHSTGVGVWIALVGSAIAAVGSVLLITVAPHSPLHPLPAGIAWVAWWASPSPWCSCSSPRSQDGVSTGAKTWSSRQIFRPRSTPSSNRQATTPTRLGCWTLVSRLDASTGRGQLQMKSEAKVVVIGGGIVGVAVLYHLTKLGWKDVVLVERKQLTAGSTWHAAAGFHSHNGSLNMSRLQSYSIHCYDEIEEISGQDVGLHRIGTVSCAATPERWDFLKMVQELNVTLGIESYLITPEEIPKYSRLIDPADLLGAVVDPADGYLDPYGATHAYAKAARIGGAEVYQRTLVQRLERQNDETWNVVTDQGTIHTEHVINAAGLWAREVGEMVGLHLPLVPYEHHYLLTEPLAAVQEQVEESMVCIDLDGGIYVRQEMGGLLFGVYEPGPVPWAVDGTPWTYGEDALLEPRLDDLAGSLEKGFRRFPMMHEAGLKTIVNGPFTFTPDGNPLLGPVRGVPNYWLACGCMAGFSQSGGMALALSEWLIHGEPTEDTFAMDPARFGSFATQAYTLEMSKQFYEWRFNVAFPNEAWPAARPAKTTPIYDLQQQAGAVFAASAANELPMWFARPGEVAEDIPSFHRPNSFDAVAEEVRAATESVGVIDISSYSKFEVSGRGARVWLDRVLASRLPDTGRGRLGAMLSEKASIIGDFMVFCLEPAFNGDERFLLTGSGPIQEWHMRWFHRFLPAAGVDVTNVSDDWMGLSVVGPRARDLLQHLTRADLSAHSFPFLAIREIDIGLAPARIGRVSLTGELGFELWAPTMYLRGVYNRLMAAGADLGIRNVGILAMLSMRLEKDFGIWGREFSPDYKPSQNHMGRFLEFAKADFVGREAALADRDGPATMSLVTLTIDVNTSDASGFEPIYADDTKVGFVTSGGYAHRTRQSLAMAYVEAEQVNHEMIYEIPLLGERHRARLLTEPAFDPAGTRMRS